MEEKVDNYPIGLGREGGGGVVSVCVCVWGGGVCLCVCESPGLWFLSGKYSCDIPDLWYAVHDSTKLPIPLLSFLLPRGKEPILSPCIPLYIPFPDLADVCTINASCRLGWFSIWNKATK